MLDIRISYLLSLVSLFGAAGLHRFYLGQPRMGFLYLFTWGLFGFGTLYDLLTMRTLVEKASFERGLLPGQDGLPPNEQLIRGVASEKGGQVTPEDVATRCNWTVAKARKELDAVAVRNGCEMVLLSGGAVVYRFDTSSGASHA